MRPLDGIRVVDFSRHLPGPTCTWLLQGLGADVVKVEPPGTGDPVRHLPPYGPDGVGAWFTALNGGKRSVALDLQSEFGRGAADALVAAADVLVEGSRPGWLSDVGLDPTRLHERDPRLVIASLSSYGQTGPWRDRPGHDLGFQALTGLLALGSAWPVAAPGESAPTTHTDRAAAMPGMPATQLADFAAGQSAALQIAAALFARERTGRGAWLDVSIADATLALMTTPLAATAAGAPPRHGRDALNGGAANYRLYRCGDGRAVAFPPLEPRLWSAFEAAVGRPVAADEDALAALFAERPREHWARVLAAAGIAPVLDPAEVLTHPLHRARGTVRGEGARARVVPPFAGAPDPGPAPALGEHTERELRRLGLVPDPHPPQLELERT